MNRASRQRYCHFAASFGLLAACFIFRNGLTRTMALHMLVHIPLILLAGVLAGWAVTIGKGTDGRTDSDCAARRFAAQCARQYADCNEYGIAGLLFVSFMGAYWMIPKALDQVLVSPALSACKFAGLYLAGIVLFDSLRRSNAVIRLFFLGNFCWMTAIVGMLYQSDSQRLCNFYLLGDQEWAGRGLVAIAVLLPLAWLFAERRSIRGFCRGAPGGLPDQPPSSNQNQEGTWTQRRTHRVRM